MSEINPKIFIVDDDEKFGKSLARLVESIGFDAEVFTSSEEFLQRGAFDEPGCLLLDVRMPGTTGPQLQEEMKNRGISMPIVFLTAHKDVPTGVKAMKDGAVDFLLKPVEEDKLFQAIDNALDKGADLQEADQIRCLLKTLTEREYEILQWIIAGMLNKQIAWHLKITERTVKAHRSQIMHKLGVVSVAELVRLTQKVGISPVKEPVES
ncbi:MAG: response regulator transcription factor [Sedimentisphaerales bacterium]|nr:response regulator transcription factor [Sedimentisphaerales bacterium]